MKKTLLAGLCLGLLLLITGHAPTQAADAPVPMKTAWLGENEAFAVWYAKRHGWDKELGLDISMLRFDSGKAIVEGVLAYDWAVAGCGAVPVLTAALNERLDIIAVANDESLSNALYVRADSPILTVKGSNPAFPEVYGDRATVAKKLILCPKATSAHYLMRAWLKALGLSEKDVRVRYMEPTPALGAFSGGLGDAVALWAPLTYEAEQKGFKAAALSGNCGVSQPVLLVADRAYAAQYPQRIEAFLKMYFRAIDMLHATPPEQLATDYILFFKEWTGLELTPEQAVRDIKAHPVFTLSQQLALFDAKQGKSKLQIWLGDIAAFYESIGALRSSDLPRLERMNAVTNVYLKAISSKP